MVTSCPSCLPIAPIVAIVIVDRFLPTVEIVPKHVARDPLYRSDRESPASNGWHCPCSLLPVARPTRFCLHLETDDRPSHHRCRASASIESAAPSVPIYRRGRRPSLHV